MAKDTPVVPPKNTPPVEDLKENNPGPELIKEPEPPKQPEISHFELYPEGLQNVSKALEDLVRSKYVRQAIIMAINDNAKPVFKQ